MSTAPPPYTDSAPAYTTRIQHARAAGRELARIKAEMEASPDPALYAEKHKTYIDACLAAHYIGDDVIIIDDDDEDMEWAEEEYVRRAPRGWWCEQYEKRVASLKRKVERGKKMDMLDLVMSFVPFPDHKWGP